MKSTTERFLVKLTVISDSESKSKEKIHSLHFSRAAIAILDLLINDTDLSNDYSFEEIKDQLKPRFDQARIRAALQELVTKSVLIELFGTFRYNDEVYTRQALTEYLA